MITLSAYKDGAAEMKGASGVMCGCYTSFAVWCIMFTH